MAEPGKKLRLSLSFGRDFSLLSQQFWRPKNDATFLWAELCVFNVFSCIQTLQQLGQSSCAHFEEHFLIDGQFCHCYYQPEFTVTLISASLSQLFWQVFGSRIRFVFFLLFFFFLFRRRTFVRRNGKENLEKRLSFSFLLFSPQVKNTYWQLLDMAPSANDNLRNKLEFRLEFRSDVKAHDKIVHFLR